MIFTVYSPSVNIAYYEEVSDKLTYPKIVTPLTQKGYTMNKFSMY